MSAASRTMPRPSPIAAIQAKFAATRRELAGSLIERDEEIDLALTAMIAGEHLLLISPPGCGKSLLLDALIGWTEGTKFSILLTKFTMPEEVVGPISLAALKEEHYRRVTTNRLPEAEMAFIDEIWKASSAILNTLLRMLNERMFENDGVFVKCPLRMCVAASNEWPNADNGGKELGAIFDRFLFRKNCRPIVSAAGERRLLWGGNHIPVLSTKISGAELDQATAAARALPWNDTAVAALEKILRELRAEGIGVSDRRKFKAVGAAQAYALLAGAAEVRTEHLEVLSHVLWDDPIEQPEKAAKVIARIANPVGMRVNQHLMEAEQILAVTDPSNAIERAESDTKLCEIVKKLRSLPADPRVTKATGYVESEIKRTRREYVETINPF